MLIEWTRILFVSILIIAFFYGLWTMAARAFRGPSPEATDDIDDSLDTGVTGWHFIERIINRPEYFNLGFSFARSESSCFSGLDLFSDQSSEESPSRSSTLIDQTQYQYKDPQDSDECSATRGPRHLDELLNPKIAMQAVVAQVDRVARARSLSRRQVEALVLEFTEGPLWGVFGEPLVDLFRLNLALDQIEARE